MSKLKSVSQHKSFWSGTIATYKATMVNGQLFGPLVKPYKIAEAAMKEIEHKRVPSLERLDRLLEKHNLELSKMEEEE
jgi:hypothetical protein